MEHEFYETQGALDAWKHMLNIDIDRYSALAIVGGDGTIHEAINGMMNRKDKKQLPIGLLPNGSGNDTGRAFHLETVEEGLSQLKAAQTVEYDLVKILIDYESEDELLQAIEADPSIQLHDHLRYSVINSSLCVAANVSKNAVSLKPKIGKHAYAVQSCIELLKKKTESFEIEYGDSNKTIRNVQASIFWIYNGKYGGGGMMLSPLSLVNDGMFELLYHQGNLPMKRTVDLFDMARAGGEQVYDKEAIQIRTNKLKLINKSLVKTKAKVKRDKRSIESASMMPEYA
jgi:diacylglycerol kinase family enzyme